VRAGSKSTVILWSAGVGATVAFPGVTHPTIPNNQIKPDIKQKNTRKNLIGTSMLLLSFRNTLKSNKPDARSNLNNPNLHLAQAHFLHEARIPFFRDDID